MKVVVKEPARAQAFVASLTTLSANKAKLAIEKGALRVNGQIELFASRRLFLGDVIEFSTIESSQDKGSCIWEDDALFFWNKAASEVCDESLLKSIAAPYPLYLVHRLDKETTGVLVLAKDKDTLAKLEDLFKTREVRKTYLALCHNKPSPLKGVLEKPIAKIRNGFFACRDEGQSACTAYSAEALGKTSLVTCKPETGRTHQIRVHLAHIGCALIGDKTYTAKSLPSYGTTRHMLHAAELGFIHPKTNKMIKAQAPEPQDFKDCLSYLRKMT